MTLAHVIDSILVGTLAEILATTGTALRQRACATDFNDTWLYWNGSAWKWAKYWQPLALLRTPFTVTASSTNEETALTYTLPALGANTMLMINQTWNSLTNNANAKTARVTVDGGGGIGSAIDMASATTGTLTTIMRNMNDASVQKWFTNSPKIYGANSGSVQGTTKVTGVAGKVLVISGQKAVGTDVMTLEYADIWICGGTA